MQILLRVLAVVAGLVAGGMTVASVEWLSSLMHPMPTGLSLDDTEGLRDWVRQLPATAGLMLLLAWFGGCLVGGFVARMLTPLRFVLPAIVVVGLFLLATIFNLATLPHPWWLWPTGILACLVGGLLGIYFAGPQEFVVATERTIDAPLEKVFQTIANIENFSKAIPHITDVEFLNEKRYGTGTRFRETRVMNGREAKADLEVTELVENEHVRIVSDMGGTIWDTVFSVKPDGDQVHLSMKMDARPRQFAAHLITPLILGMVTRAVEGDMDIVKNYCESAS